jgi:quercetin dioxygenase-like cupin family protein
MYRMVLGLSLALLAGAGARAETADGSDLKWGPAPAVFPKGAQLAVLSGDPFKPGVFVLRLKMPAGYKIPAHHHPTDEMVTVISGDFALGMGDKLDPAKATKFKSGGFVNAMAGMNHYAWTTGGAVVEVTAMGPFGMTYVDPKDDPSK